MLESGEFCIQPKLNAREYLCTLWVPSQRVPWKGYPLAQAHLNLSRVNHRLPRAQTHPEVVQGTAEFHHEIADTLLPQADPVLHNAAALHTAVDMLDPQPTLVEHLVGPLWLQG
jgi:hypothetical protein